MVVLSLSEEMLTSTVDAHVAKPAAPVEMSYGDEELSMLAAMLNDANNYFIIPDGTH